jgi:hypothetical protein
VIVGSMFNVFSGSLVSFKVFKSLKKLKSSLNSIWGCLVDISVNLKDIIYVLVR